VLDMSAASVAQLLDNYKHSMAALNLPAKDAKRPVSIKLERAELLPVSAAR
jgi:hypothetical protein